LNSQPTTVDLNLAPANNKRLADLCGQFNEHLIQLEQRLHVEVKNRGNHFNVCGHKDDVVTAVSALQYLYKCTETDHLTPEKVHLLLQESQMEISKQAVIDDTTVIRTRKKIIKPRGGHQRSYVKSMPENDIVFGIGPAGTGKTYLAVACAVEALEAEKVARIILARPAVEAGERLGFLPGDMRDKIDPYLRPLYDALYDMMPPEQVDRRLETGEIEVAPLAFMRGRTLSNAYVILDEAQNATPVQMKMFLTRLGENARMVVTGDLSQIDLPRGVTSGLRHAIQTLEGVPGVEAIQLRAEDVVRHELVSRIVSAYEAVEAEADAKENKDA